MTSVTTKPDSLQPEAETAPQLFDDWLDPIETEVRERARHFIEELIRGELDAVLAFGMLSSTHITTTPSHSPGPRKKSDNVGSKAAVSLSCDSGY